MLRSCISPHRAGTVFADLVIAISLAVLTTVAVYDSLTLGSALLQEETSAASCEQPRF